MKIPIQIRILLFTAIVIAVSLLVIKENMNKLSTDISILLPQDHWASAHLQFMRNSRLGSVIAISIKAENEDAVRKFPAAAHKLNENLKDLEKVQKVIAVINTDLTIKAGAYLFKNMNQLFSENELRKFSRKITPQQVDIELKKRFQELMTPGGLFKQKLIARDPMNFFSIIIQKLKKLSTNSDFYFKINNSVLTSKDGKHMLVLIYADLNVTDPDQSQIFFNKLNTVLNRLLPADDYKVTLISAHRHAIENKKLLQRDITITMLAASIGFFLLFIFFFRDWRSIYIFLIPVIGIFISAALTFLFFRTPSAIILGLGTTVIGIALDYGIHVYTASKHPQVLRKKSLSNIKRPLFFSALTTLGVFWAFFLSGTPGYHQLAFASTMGIAVSLLISLYILPSLLPENTDDIPNAINRKILLKLYHSKKKAFSVILIWSILVLLSVSVIYRIKFESDIRKLDGTTANLKQDEENFRKVWGDNTMAAAATSSEDLSQAMETIDLITESALNRKVKNIQSISSIWPSIHTRRKNAKAWTEFWKSGNEDKLKYLLAKEGEKFSFSDNAFTPFFDSLYNISYPSDKEFITGPLSTIAGRFINFKNHRWHVSMFFPDTAENIAQMRKIAETAGNTDIISPSSFGTYISGIIINDAVKIGITSIILTVLLALICLKSLSKTAAAFAPVISGLTAVLPVFMLTGTPVNVVVCVASIIVTGLAIDYGIFSVSACSSKDSLFSKDAFSALSLSLISTFIGSSALLFADHPALFSVGLVVSSGVSAAYIAAVFVTPALLTLLSKTSE